MDSYQDFYNAIDEIRECIKRDLFGCSSEYEEFDGEEPISAYSTGILYPLRSSGKSATEEDPDEEKDCGEDFTLENSLEADDDTITAANKYLPSSMGLSVMTDGSAEKLSVKFEFGTYAYFEEENKYRRSPWVIETEFDIPDRCKASSQEFRSEKYNISVNLTVRKILPDKSKLVTISVSNITPYKRMEWHRRNELAIFQCKLTVSSDISFLPVYTQTTHHSDTESQIKDLLYKDVKNYAYGHGCSVSYTETPEGIFEITSDFIPCQQVLQMMPGEIEDKDILLLSHWNDIPRNEAYTKLNSFISEYEAWKDKTKEEAKALTQYKDAGEELVRRIEECIARLRNGADVLKDNDKAWQSFLYMNEAMLLQRINTKHQKAEDVRWYPFQLAYILMIIPDIVNEESSYRNCVDLLWFPTGGGKTEAYLGVAAFTIFYRRLSENITDDGVTIIMRYTLRLLTIQQFERAAAMICACEYIRKREHIGGGEISIGLWIGSGMTPNSVKDAEDAVTKLKNDSSTRIHEGNPVQITTCPWCGTKIDITGYDIRNGSLEICCHDNPECEFHDNLPIYVVDEDIYKYRPTLLLSTIDKFARIAWVSDAKKLFGVDDIPPSLIIQDELHLISGSLGSLAGLYEIAIEYLCTKDGVSPKIIASTATVRNADVQIKNLYNKRMFQFPPNGITFEDSFFSHIADKDQRPARTYIGVCESSGSMLDLFIRIYAVLTYVKELFSKQNKSTAVRDQYYTIVGYFNALADLGTASNILLDHINAHLRGLMVHKFKDLSEKYGITNISRKFTSHNEELTSRKTSKEIKETLSNLEKDCDEPDCYSYVLASNMLSVGIDINRLGVMTMYCQPKTNAEYIQATSRVGRRFPGLVIAMYNPMRTRDRSHYEQFAFYHSSFYQYVEATSVTPFSLSAMSKALHCVFIAMVRQSVPELNRSPVSFRGNDERIQNIKQYIVDYVRKLSPRTADDAEYLLDELIDAWENIVRNNVDVCYENAKPGQISLLNTDYNPLSDQFPTILNSLRNVERSVNVYTES